MRTLRFYLPHPLVVGEYIQVPDNTSRHISQVLRLREGEEVTVFNGNNCEYTAVISGIEKKSVQLKILTELQRSKESGIQIHLIQGISKGDRMDWVIQKATELGVTSIQPVNSKRTNVNLSLNRADKKLAHWSGIINSACEQCGRNLLPELHAVMDLNTVVKDHYFSQIDNKIILNPFSSSKLQQTDMPGSQFVLAIGPEGGFDPLEIKNLEEAGFKSFSLGPRILRTETAAIAGITLLQALFGDL